MSVQTICILRCISVFDNGIHFHINIGVRTRFISIPEHQYRTKVLRLFPSMLTNLKPLPDPYSISRDVEIAVVRCDGSKDGPEGIEDSLLWFYREGKVKGKDGKLKDSKNSKVG
jgi:hypothetical protein